jgi:hypothetical protein
MWSDVAGGTSVARALLARVGRMARRTDFSRQSRLRIERGRREGTTVFAVVRIAMPDAAARSHTERRRRTGLANEAEDGRVHHEHRRWFGTRSVAGMSTHSSVRSAHGLVTRRTVRQHHGSLTVNRVTRAASDIAAGVVRDGRSAVAWSVRVAISALGYALPAPEDMTGQARRLGGRVAMVASLRLGFVTPPARRHRRPGDLIVAARGRLVFDEAAPASCARMALGARDLLGSDVEHVHRSFACGSPRRRNEVDGRLRRRPLVNRKHRQQHREGDRNDEQREATSALHGP